MRQVLTYKLSKQFPVCWARVKSSLETSRSTFWRDMSLKRFYWVPVNALEGSSSYLYLSCGEMLNDVPMVIADLIDISYQLVNFFLYGTYLNGSRGHIKSISSMFRQVFERSLLSASKYIRKEQRYIITKKIRTWFQKRLIRKFY